MSWKEVSIMSQRQEFINFVLREGSNIAELCRRFNISRKTAYKFVSRYKQYGIDGLRDRSRRPSRSPAKTASETEQLIIALRQRHQAWGGRKIKRRLEDLGYTAIPCPSTITAILKRKGYISEQESQRHTAWKRFQAQAPNDLWQMDFKGDFAAREGRCHPLTVLDDHSRYCLGIAACPNERGQTVQQRLTLVFCTYGLPLAMIMDNGPPWGNDAMYYPYTRFTVWLMKLGINIRHSRPCHPQTMGKDERFHRTLKAEAIAQCLYRPIERCQEVFDDWRVVYNMQRPHESLNMRTPACVYSISRRSFPERFPDDEYSPGDAIRKVFDKGFISFKNKEFRIGKAFEGERVAIRPAKTDGHFAVFFYGQHIATINLTNNT